METYRTKVDIHYIELNEKKDEIDLDEFKKTLGEKPVKPGDLVVDITNAGYRMDGVCIIDIDDNVIELDYEIDEYGAIPMSLTCPDKFTPNAILDSEKGAVFKWHNYLIPINLEMFAFEKHTSNKDRRVYIEKYDDMTFAFIVPLNFDLSGVMYFELSNPEDYVIAEKVDYIMVEPSLL